MNWRVLIRLEGGVCSLWMEFPASRLWLCTSKEVCRSGGDLFDGTVLQLVNCLD